MYETIIVFDHFKHQIILITNVNTTDKNNLQVKYDSAVTQLEKLRFKLSKTISYKSNFKSVSSTISANLPHRNEEL
ncbi:MAG: hypothetical protein A3J84_09800 [Ignavibacteria bacterium RIFOXYA2_FULL_37_17]|nr:MAG: hypothetical protein A3J84_09800 [Ignavibacteria bacterium RIFOXYA2_FULL_37_17]